MTLDDRARKIWQILFPKCTLTKNWDLDLELIVAELRAVQEEGKQERWFLKATEKEAFKSGLLKAAEIVESFKPLDFQPHIDSTKKALSERISKLASEPNP